MPGYEDDAQPKIVTDHDGRFTVNGIGVDRVARLGLRGEAIAYAQFNVVARTMKPIACKSGFYRQRTGVRHRVHVPGSADAAGRGDRA